MADKQLLAALHEPAKIAQLRVDLGLPASPPPPADDEEPWNDVAEIHVSETRITRSECMKGFRVLGLDWTQDAIYFIKDKSGSRTYLYLIRYRAHDAVDQDTAGAFWVERLTEAY